MIFIINEEDLKINKQINILYFYSSKMLFYTRFCNILEILEKENKKIICYAINVNNFKNLCDRFSIASVPTIVIFKDSAEVERFEGLTLKSAIDSAVKSLY